MKILAIGDTHFRVNNIDMISMFIEKLLQATTEIKPDIVVLLGDILHDHERLHTTPMNKAYEMIRSLRDISPVFVLVGNHDMINHRQFLSDKHWMNAMKEWNNVYIIDKTLHLQFFDKNNSRTQISFCPYVAPGRFVEALGSKEQLQESGSDFKCYPNHQDEPGKGILVKQSTYHHSFKEMCDNDPKIWMKSNLIFAHQEFYGCKMGALVSEEGDKWSLTWPEVVSGHIHSKQTPQKNIYYTGSSMQVAYGESEQNIIALLEITDSEKTIKKTEINLRLPMKKIVYLETSEFSSFTMPETNDEIKLSISGTYEDFKAMKKTSKFKKLLKQGIKIVFRHTKNDEATSQVQKDTADFEEILLDLIQKEQDPNLNEIWKLVKTKI